LTAIDFRRVFSTLPVWRAPIIDRTIGATASTPLLRLLPEPKRRNKGAAARPALRCFAAPGVDGLWRNVS
jgi:hypothetical protein